MSATKNCFPGTGKEKSSFAMTCNRLSSFLREKGSLKDIEITAPFDVKGIPESYSLGREMNKTTVDLLSKIESPVNMSVITEESINHLPQYVRVDSLCKPEDSTNKTVSDELVELTESKTSQMTILYKGQVLVFDCISADKARNMMLAACAFSSSSSPGLQINGLDLPIARRSSLHKFLSKKKERASERAPYQLPNRLTAVPSNYKFDLNV